ncbi:MFS transporter [Ferrovibrio sp.]|uniref:MFS transporter n=1 Tax=Ferrovibrio sp. TaxID=1917215 RepID=UPI0035B415C0
MSVGYRILACTCLTYVISQFYRSANAVIGPDLMRELHLSPEDLGILTGAFFITFSVSQIPVGIAIDRWGPRRTILVTLAIAFLGALWFANGDGLAELTAARIVLGFGCAALLIAPMVLFSRWFAPEKFATISGILIAVGSLGVIASTIPLAWFSAQYGWRNAFYVTAGITLVMGIASFFVLQDTPPNASTAGTDRASAKPETLAETMRGVAEAIGNPNFKYLFVMFFNVYATFITIMGLWSGPYLHDVHGLDSTARGQVLIYMAVASALSYFFWGPLDRIFNTRKWIIIPCTICQLFCVSVLAMLPGLGLLAATVIFTIMGVLNGITVVIFAHGRSIFPAHIAGRGMTALNIGTMGGAAFQQVLTGYLMGAVTPIGQQPNEFAYRVVFGIQALLLLAAIVFYLRVPDAKPHAAKP